MLFHLSLISYTIAALLVASFGWRARQGVGIVTMLTGLCHLCLFLRNSRTWIRRHLDPLSFQDCLLSPWLTCQSITKATSYHLQPGWLIIQESDQIKTKHSGASVSSQKNPLLFLIGTQRLSKHSLFNPYSVTSGKYKYQNVTNREAGGELNFPAICLRLSKWAVPGREHSLPTSGPVRQEALDAAGPSCVPCSNCINQTLELPGYEASYKHCVFMCFALSNSMDQRDQNFDIPPHRQDVIPKLRQILTESKNAN